nr:unnamed protein product [Spirometra erinaceieuropaei]
MHSFMRHQRRRYTIYVIEQVTPQTFNRAALLNIGYREAVKAADYSCFIFHDVDLLPEDDRMQYACEDQPLHMSANIDKFNYSQPTPRQSPSFEPFSLSPSLWTPASGVFSHWRFVVADIHCAILGADFLAAFDLLVDRRRSSLRDMSSNLFFRVAKAELEHMLQMGIIPSPWASSLHMVPKATTADWRPFDDYGALNKVVVLDGYPVPHLQDLPGALLGKSVLSKIHVVRAFHQTPITLKDVSKTAFTTLFSFFEFLCMHFGPRDACQDIHRFMYRVPPGLPFAYAYIDDLLLANFTTEEHMEHLATMFDRLQLFGVVLDPSNHLVDVNDIHPLLSKVTAIRDFPPPSSKCQLQRFLGVVNFYRRFLPHCADTILPLMSLLSGPKRSFELFANTLAAFHKVKAALADAIFLTHFSPDASISLMVSASNVAFGADLQQYACRRTSSPLQTRYSTFGQELLAVFLAVIYFRHFLDGRDFTVFMDHKTSHSHSIPREIRQLDYISQFTSGFHHINGSSSEMADALSRPSIAHLQLSPRIGLAEMVAEQRCVGFFCDEEVSGLQLQDLPLTTGNRNIPCGVFITFHRPFVPPFSRRKVFSSLHNLSYPVSRAIDKLISECFVWSGMHMDLKSWTRVFLSCQRSMVRPHNKEPSPNPNALFSHVHLDIAGPASV